MKQKRKQKEKTLIPILGIGFFATFFIMIVVLCISRQTQTQTAFTPPPFEVNAIKGVPDVPNDLGYSAPYKEGMAYHFAVCGNVVMDGRNATVYFTNPKENEVWLKLRVLDEAGNVLGETGLLKAGEYVELVELLEELPVGTPVKLKIMSYEPKTYYSVGSVMLDTMIGSVS